jgi:hypothetical protein
MLDDYGLRQRVISDFRLSLYASTPPVSILADTNVNGWSCMQVRLDRGSMRAVYRSMPEDRCTGRMFSAGKQVWEVQG